jgi:hypothetical protein
MRDLEFMVELSSKKTEEIYRGQARYLLVECDNGLKLQLPAVNFRSYVTEQGINGRFRIQIDANNKIIDLTKL